MEDIKPDNTKRIKAARRSQLAAQIIGQLFSKSPQNSRAFKLVSWLGKIAAGHDKPSPLPRTLSYVKGIAARLARSSFVKLFQRSRRYRAYSGLVIALFLVSIVATVADPFLKAQPYRLNDAARAVLPRQNDDLTQYLKFDGKTGVYEYNQSYSGRNSSENGLNGTGTPRFNASMSKEPTKGVTVKDPINDLTLTLKPKFRLQEGKQDKNQIFYRLGMGNGYLVYTSQVTGVKEDIVLGSYTKDKLAFEYELGLPGGAEARLETNGSVGVYGSDLPINGNVSTGSDKDKELLEKARQKSTKNKLMFTLPSPVVVESNKTVSDVKARFELEGTSLRVVAEKLKGASYPLSIDPSIYVETAQKLMRGNNETNLDFDVTNELIQKGKLTGARFNSWNSSLALPANRYGHTTAVYGGYIYVAGGDSGSGSTATVYWAKLNTTTGAIEAPNPGNGVCASWCTAGVYDLPAARVGASMVAYNGYLYVMGGHSTNAASPTSTVYIAKLGLNGEPSLWHPTDTNQTNWVYWYTEPTNTLPAARTFSAAVAYNNRMYLLGGYNGTSAQTTVHVVDLNPIGTTSAWSTTGMVALASARFGHSAQVYNDRIYVIGGASSTSAVSSTVYYMKLKSSDGTMAGATWATTKAFNTARMTAGGNFSTIWGGYIYISGGCSGVSTTSSIPSCATAVLNDLQIASINADGTISDWVPATIPSPVARSNYSLVSWRGTIYGVGGCTTLTCSSSASAVANYGIINQDGDASSVRDSVPSGTSPCDAAGGYRDCDLPPEGTNNGQGGRMSGGAIVNNGFIYYIGGCTAVGSNSVCFTGNSGKASDNISYASVRSDGVIVRVASCSGGTLQFVGSWCVDNTNTLNGSSGLAGFGFAVFNNTFYIVGGTTGTSWQSTVFRQTPNADGSLNAWSAAQTFSAIGITDTVSGTTARGYSYVFTRSNPSSAGTNPGNLYVLGGCTGPSGAAENGLNCQGTPNPVFNSVWKCNIGTDTSLNGCTQTGQTLIDAETGISGDQGLGVMAGAVYANYVYLVGGQSTNENDRGKIIYAKIDNNNNIVPVSGSTWITSSNQISPSRTRGYAFGYNGYLYAIAGYASGTSLNDLLFAKINTSDGSIGAFVTSNVTVSARWDLRVMVNNGYVYTMGGCSTGVPPSNCTAMTGNVQVFQLFNNFSGAPALYSTSANLFATDRLAHGVAIMNGYIYVAGGCIGLGDCSVVTADTQFAAIDSNGVVGAWASTTAAIPASRGWGKMVATGGSLYFIGGQDTITGAFSTVYFSTPSTSTGQISSWSTATNGLPAARTKFGAAVWNNRIYVVGGYNGSAVQSTVYVSPQLNSGGNITSAWASSTAFNVARSGVTAITYANNLYILGGSSDNGSTILGDVQVAKINSDGTIPSGGWTYTSSLTDKLYGADGFAYNGFIYLYGGRSTATVCETNTIAAPISANTTIASGNNPTGIGEWFETNEKYVGSRYGAQAAYWEGKAYITGGGCGTTLTYTGANRIVQTTLLAQPQVAKYSRIIDTDTDVFPNNWLMNGLDNDIGARWRASYKSMHDLDSLVNPNEDCGTSPTMPQMTTWGQSTDVGEVTLGMVNTYIPKNSTGGNINCARYFYFFITIDSSQAYGYPEDVTRGPTIADLTLFFTSDPSKRLRHGKTFTGGEQQPLDTPF